METRVYNIDSQDRNKTIDSNSNSYTYTESNIGNNIYPFNLENVIELQIKNFIIPNVIYFINNTKGNNIINIDGSNITINSGSYTISDLVHELNINPTMIAKSLSFDYNNYTGKLTISNTGTSTVTFNFPDLGIYNNDSLKYNLGFRDDYDFDTNINIIVGDTILPYPMEHAIEKYFFLNINDIGPIYYKNRQYMAKIYTDIKYRYDDINLSLSYDYIGPLFKFNQPNDIKNLKISLVDRFNNPIEINNIDYSFTLETKIIYNSILKQYTELFSYSDEVMNKILSNKMLEYYNKNTENKENLLEFDYDDNMTLIHNNVENEYYIDDEEINI